MSTPVFGEVFICKRCGKLARQRFTFSMGNSPEANDAHAIEYCEHCQPRNLLEATIDFAQLGQGEPVQEPTA